MHGRFETPVEVYIGLGFPRQVESAREAYEVLMEWPRERRGPAHGAAIEACFAAMGGKHDAESARNAFETFAVARGILAEPALAAAVQDAAEEWLRG
ncbi:DUF982 domain-containing protein [Aquamicrobium sp. LC103]|uniref:DUF982 domain-containing protein n=1 Tax=Aquamicrobium sp. LC103 TaxID=1120658 RepID=UPI00063EB38E|nr:DUF982 domain-containing protein [Aquamicrobium sp. LC103]TKT75081.1 DUF982 domain-containing protein [Aquamicrobium sp. LC103]